MALINLNGDDTAAIAELDNSTEQWVTTVMDAVVNDNWAGGAVVDADATVRHILLHLASRPTSNVLGPKMRAAVEATLRAAGETDNSWEQEADQLRIAVDMLLGTYGLDFGDEDRRLVGRTGADEVGEVIREELYSSQQSDWWYKRITNHGGTRLYVEIRRNFYEFQSYGKVSRWDGTQWQVIISVPIEGLRCFAVSATAKEADKALFIADADGLVTTALAVAA